MAAGVVPSLSGSSLRIWTHIKWQGKHFVGATSCLKKGLAKYRKKCSKIALQWVLACKYWSCSNESLYSRTLSREIMIWFKMALVIFLIMLFKTVLCRKIYCFIKSIFSGSVLACIQMKNCSSYLVCYEFSWTYILLGQ